MGRVSFRVGAALLIGVVALGLAWFATADEQPLYLTPAQIDFSKMLPPPTSDDSEATKLEMAELHRVIQDSSPERKARARYDHDNQDLTIYNELFGPGFDLTRLSLTKKLFDEVQHDRRAATDLAKETFRRRRPAIQDPTLAHCGESWDPNSSYPSGHSAWGFSSGVVLAAMVPEKAPAILARSREFAESRMVCGMHFRSDTVAGQVVGTVVGERLLANPAFKVKFDAAATELRAAIPKP